MALRRVFVDRVAAGRAIAAGARAHHLARVVRLQEGERVEVSNGARVWLAEAESVDPRGVVFLLGEALPAAPPAPHVELHLALIKFARFEWAIEKATELGAATIVPVVAAHSDAALAKAAAKRLERWERIAEEAAQQARRLSAPAISPPAPLEQALLRPVQARILIDFDGQELSEKDLAGVSPEGTVAVLIGPEGGWTSAEAAAARAAGASAVTLGRQVLRSETAALAALSVVGRLLRTLE